MSSIHDMQKAIENVRHNPAAIQRYTLDMLKQTHEGGIDIVDATNPFIFLMMSSAVHASAAMTEAANLTRQQYPSMAITEDELYLHMSDRDHIGRFSTPARTHFSLLLNKAEIIKKAVATEDTRFRKLTIPRHSEFTVSDYTFTMQYPIDIRVMAHGGLQVVYDASEVSPLETLDSNIVAWNTVSLGQADYVRIDIPVSQIALSSRMAQINKASAYQKTFTLTDHFYYCRVWKAQSGGGWTEILTTHTDQVFDPMTPTVLLKVYQNKLTVSVPHVYIATGLLESELRIDIYTTKGPLDLLLESYPANAFGARWRDVAKNSLDSFSAPLTSFSGITLFSDAVVSGGTHPLTFETLRERVLTNAVGNAVLPITNNQMYAQLSNRGYTPILDVDNITRRIYLASRDLPAPLADNVQAPVGCLIGKLQANFNQLANRPGVINNNARLTITPSALFQLNNGVIDIVNTQRRREIDSQTGQQFIATINDGRYLYSPFHYVLDTTGNYFYTRAYHLSQPQVVSRQFIQENDSLEIILSTRSIAVEKHEFGYRLVVVTQSGGVAKTLPDSDVYVQLGIRPQGQNVYVFQLGELQGRTADDERVYHFDIETNWDIDADHGLEVGSFAFDGEGTRTYTIDIEPTFDIVYYVKPKPEATEARYILDFIDGRFLVPTDFYGLVHEQATVRFGRYLEGFWENSRSILDSTQYARYEETVYSYYENNVYERDPDTGHLKLTVDDGGNIVYNVLHRKGDPVLDKDGESVVRFEKGDVKTDFDGNPIETGTRDIIRESDLFLLDGRYFFADEQEATQYIDNTVMRIESWLLEDIHQFRQWALEQTAIYLYPRRTIGKAPARIKENEKAIVDLEQSFEVTFFLSRERYRDAYIREVLGDMAQVVIAEELRKRRVTVNSIVSTLTERAGEDALALKVEGLGGEENLAALTLESDTDRCSIRKRLYRTLDGQYTVNNDIRVIFLRHEDQ